MAERRLRATAAILAGGLGTRLRPVIVDRPKVLAPINGRPFLTYLLDQLAGASVEEVVLLVGFQAGQVRDTLGQTYAGMRLLYSEEPFPLGTAGALRWALPKLSEPTILVMNGDSYCDIDLAAFRAFHDEHSADVSLALAGVTGASRFGSVWAGEDGKVTRFEEKTAVPGANWINAGIYLLKCGLIDEIPIGGSLSLERDLFPQWVEMRRCYGFHSAGRFLDIGTPESYSDAEHFFRDSPYSASVAT
jgi:NDP-sugar pyrophosphorylase family protein